MRIKLKLDDDALKTLREYSQKRSLTLGTAASELIRLGMMNGICTFVIPKGGKKITIENVKKLLDEEDLDRALKFT